MKMPEEVTRQISVRAAAIAQQLAPRATGKGASLLAPTSSAGEIGIEVPDSVHYMIYQDQGTKPRVMTELIGKTIPIRTPSGSIIFRRATEKNVGERSITSRDEKGRIITTRLAWRNPGIKAQHFIDRALRQAVSEWVMSASSREVVAMLDSSEIAFLMKTLRGEK